MVDYTKILSNLRILYAEDNEKVRESISKTLKIVFKDVIIAKNGKEVLDCFQKEDVDIILIDYIMPMINGGDVAKEIRKIDSSIPIIIASGHTEKEKLMEAIDLNIIKYIEKPIKYDILQEALNKSVDKLQLLNRLHVNLGNEVKYDFIRKVILNPANEQVKLTKQEIQLMEIFIKNRTYLVSKQLIIDSLFDEYVEENTVRNLIYRMRKKISPKKIETVKDLGYIMN